MNWLSMLIGAVFLICMIVGFMRGAVKIIVSLAATVVTLVLVWQMRRPPSWEARIRAEWTRTVCAGC